MLYCVFFFFKSTIFYHIFTTLFMEKLKKTKQKNNNPPVLCVRQQNANRTNQRKMWCSATPRCDCGNYSSVEQTAKHKTQNPHGALNAVLKVPCCAEFNVPIFSKNNMENRSTVLQPNQTLKVSGKAKCSSNRWNPYFFLKK